MPKSLSTHNKVFFSSSSNLIPGTPVRVKRLIVEAREMTSRWKEEVQLLKKEMASFIEFYVDLFHITSDQIKEIKTSIEGYS